MKEIPLTRGKVAIVDDWACPILSKYKWNASISHRKYYAVGWSSRRQTTVYMHTLLLDTLGLGLQGDHINGNSLDNRLANLRICTTFQNARNVAKRKDNVSGFKGVCWKKKDSRWYAVIRVEGKQLYLGSFKMIEEAARAYDQAAIKYHGPFARLNFP